MYVAVSVIKYLYCVFSFYSITEISFINGKDNKSAARSTLFIIFITHQKQQLYGDHCSVV